MQVETAMPDDGLDVGHGQFAVPAGVDVHHERPQSPFVDADGKVGAIDATAQAEDAIVFLAAPRFLDRVDDRGPALSSLVVRIPACRPNSAELDAVVANALGV